MAARSLEPFQFNELDQTLGESIDSGRPRSARGGKGRGGSGQPGQHAARRANTDETAKPNSGESSLRFRSAP